MIHRLLMQIGLCLRMSRYTFLSDISI